MASHFSDIGFALESEDDYAALVERAASEGKTVTCPLGRYLHWTPGAGVELWIQVDSANVLVGGNPHFVGTGRVSVALTAPLRDAQYPFDGGFHAWADPDEDDPESGSYPFVFDVPDFDALDPDWTYPRRTTAQVAAFAHELACFPDEDSYDRSQQSEKPGFASESFIPSGLFGGEEGARPRATALFTGHILQAERRTNPASGADFHWLSVRTYGGVYDVVADPALLAEPPVVGGIAQGAFWLSGRLLPEIGM